MIDGIVGVEALGEKSGDGHEAVFDRFRAEALVDHGEATQAEQRDEAFAAAFHQALEVFDGGAAAAQAGSVVVGSGMVGGAKRGGFGGSGGSGGMQKLFHLAAIFLDAGGGGDAGDFLQQAIGVGSG